MKSYAVDNIKVNRKVRKLSDYCFADLEKNEN